MGAELAMISSLKNDIRTFGGATKEVTLTAGEDITLADEIAIGTDGLAYKQEYNGAFTGTKASSYGFNNYNANESVSFATLPDGTPIYVKSIENGNNNTQWQMVAMLPKPDGTMHTITLRSAVGYQYSSPTNTYNTLIAPIVSVIDADHVLVSFVHGYRYYNGSAYSASAWVYSYVLKVDAGRTFLSTVQSSSTTAYSNAATSAFPRWGSYGLSYERSSGVVRHNFYGNTYYYYEVTADPATYAITYATYTEATELQGYSSNHYGYAITRQTATGSETLINLAPTSTGNTAVTIHSSGAYTSRGSESTIFSGVSNATMTTIDDRLFVFDGETSSFIVEFDAAGVPTKVPLTLPNAFYAIINSPYYRKSPFVKLGTDDYMVAFSKNEATQVYTKADTTGSYTMRDIGVYRLQKVGTAYVMTELYTVPAAQAGGFTPVVTEVGGTSLLIANAFNRFDTTIGGIICDTAVYTLPTVNTTKPVTAPIYATALTAALAGSPARCVFYGAIADINLPAGAVKNGFTGLGNGQSIKGKKVW